jgi:hypothetical protein
MRLAGISLHRVRRPRAAGSTGAGLTGGSDAGLAAFGRQRDPGQGAGQNQPTRRRDTNGGGR